MEPSFFENFETLRKCVETLLATYYLYIVSAAIGFGTVYFTVLINHLVRLRRIKLIHGFAGAFSPVKHGEGGSTKQLGARHSDDAKSGTVGSAPKKRNDIRYSPSLEFVVSKYLTDLDEAVGPNEFERLKECVKMGEDDTRKDGKVPIEYLLRGIGCFGMPVNRRMVFSALPAIVALSAGWYIVLQALRSIAPLYWTHVYLPSAEAGNCYSHLVPLGIVFFAAYVASIRILVRAVSLFDLTPVTFLRVFLHIMASMLAGYVIWALLSSPACQSTWNYALYPALFMIGFIPDGGINAVLAQAGAAADERAPATTPGQPTDPNAASRHVLARLASFVKQTDGRFGRATRSTPLDVIDGIDFFTRFRLEEAGIYEVQNLATANPILLHVETPFGIYQTIDWVGQAQLCTVVGIERFLIFRQLNIRTVFDLERAVLSLKATSEIRKMVGGILFMPTTALTEIESLGASGNRFPDLGLARQGPTEPNQNPGYLSALEYCKRAASECSYPSSYRLTLPETRSRPISSEPPPAQPEAPQPLPQSPKIPKVTAACDTESEVRYRVYPIVPPKGLTSYAKFEIIDGRKRDVLDIYDVTNETDASIKHAVRLIMDDLHVMRLRQIWESIGRSLGTDAATLDDSEDTFLGA